MLQRIPTYLVEVQLQDQTIRLRVPGDRVDLLVNVFMFNGVSRLLIELEE